MTSVLTNNGHVNTESPKENTVGQQRPRDWIMQLQTKGCQQLSATHQKLEEARKGSSTSFRETLALLIP